MSALHIQYFLTGVFCRGWMTILQGMLGSGFLKWTDAALDHHKGPSCPKVCGLNITSDNITREIYISNLLQTFILRAKTDMKELHVSVLLNIKLETFFLPAPQHC